jgi:hypothetical protein
VIDRTAARKIEALAPRLRLGEVKGFRLKPFTSQVRGKDAAMGFAKKGRISDYASVMSYILREATYRNNEVSPRFDVVVVLALTGERRYDERIQEVASYWCYLTTRGLSGGVAILNENGGRFQYEPPARDWFSASRVLRAHSVAESQREATVNAIRGFSGCIGSYYDGAHLVVIGSYWEHDFAKAYSQGQPYGTTFCMVESPLFSGSSFFGDVLPQQLVKERVSQRGLQLTATCRRLRANCLIFQGDALLLDSFCEGLSGARIL